MRRLAVVVALALAGSVLVGAPAHAANPTPGCATKPEYARIHNGQKPSKVASIIGASGKVTTDINVGGSRLVTRDYRTCAPYRSGVVVVTYQADPGEALRVTSRAAFWWA